MTELFERIAAIERYLGEFNRQLQENLEKNASRPAVADKLPRLMEAFQSTYYRVVDDYLHVSHANDMNKYTNTVLSELVAFGGAPEPAVAAKSTYQASALASLGLDIIPKVQSKYYGLALSYISRQLQMIINEVYLQVYAERAESLETLRTLGYCVGLGSVWVNRSRKNGLAPSLAESSDYDFQ